MNERAAILIFGPTASGKSKTALELSKNIDSIIINTDSLQVYKDLQILTSRPSTEDQKNVPHKLYGTQDGKSQNTVANWIKHACAEIELSFQEKKTPILVGGTGLYFKALEEGLAEIPDIEQSVIDSTNKIINEHGINYLFNELLKKNPNCTISSNDKNRIIRAYNVLMFTGEPIDKWQINTKPIIRNIKYHKFLINSEREDLYTSAERRFDKMIEEGAVDEVKKLNSFNHDKESTIMKAIGVREINEFFLGNVTLSEAIALAKQKTRNYIKRQQTWIKSNNISWNRSFKKLMKSF